MTASALRLEPAWPDPERVVEVVRSAGPFWPLANYAASDAEMAALGSRHGSFTPPWFRQDFATLGQVLVPGAEVILHNPNFVAAAQGLSEDGAVVRPTTVYVNVMGPTPFPFAPHLDVPAFRGFTRTDHPLWLLKVMKTSGLFEQWRTKIVTAVSWFYDGAGGDFHYWPDGPDGAGCVESPPFANVAVVADNEETFHGVAPLGAPGARMPDGLDRDSRLTRGDGGWDVRDGGGAILARFADADARVTVSWKADVFADVDEAARVDAGDDPLDLATVVEVFLADLEARGLDAPRPTDPHADRDWVAAVGAAYRDPAPSL